MPAHADTPPHEFSTLWMESALGITEAPQHLSLQRFVRAAVVGEQHDLAEPIAINSPSRSTTAGSAASSRADATTTSIDITMVAASRPTASHAGVAGHERQRVPRAAPPTTIGGRGRCTGPGVTGRSDTVKCSPEWVIRPRSKA